MASRPLMTSRHFCCHGRCGLYPMLPEASRATATTKAASAYTVVLRRSPPQLGHGSPAGVSSRFVSQLGQVITFKLYCSGARQPKPFQPTTSSSRIRPWEIVDLCPRVKGAGQDVAPRWPASALRALNEKIISRFPPGRRKRGLALSSARGGSYEPLQALVIGGRHVLGIRVLQVHGSASSSTGIDTAP